MSGLENAGNGAQSSDANAKKKLISGKESNYQSHQHNDGDDTDEENVDGLLERTAQPDDDRPRKQIDKALAVNLRYTFIRAIPVIFVGGVTVVLYVNTTGDGTEYDKVGGIGINGLQGIFGMSSAGVGVYKLFQGKIERVVTLLTQSGTQQTEDLLSPKQLTTTNGTEPLPESTESDALKDARILVQGDTRSKVSTMPQADPTKKSCGSKVLPASENELTGEEITRCNKALHLSGGVFMATTSAGTLAYINFYTATGVTMVVNVLETSAVFIANAPLFLAAGLPLTYDYPWLASYYIADTVRLLPANVNNLRQRNLPKEQRQFSNAQQRKLDIEQLRTDLVTNLNQGLSNLNSMTVKDQRALEFPFSADYVGKQLDFFQNNYVEGSLAVYHSGNQYYEEEREEGTGRFNRCLSGIGSCLSGIGGCLTSIANTVRQTPYIGAFFGYANSFLNGTIGVLNWCLSKAGDLISAIRNPIGNFFTCLADGTQKIPYVGAFFGCANWTLKTIIPAIFGAALASSSDGYMCFVQSKLSGGVLHKHEYDGLTWWLGVVAIFGFVNLSLKFGPKLAKQAYEWFVEGTFAKKRPTPLLWKLYAPLRTKESHFPIGYLIFLITLGTPIGLTIPSGYTSEKFWNEDCDWYWDKPLIALWIMNFSAALFNGVFGWLATEGMAIAARFLFSNPIVRANITITERMEGLRNDIQALTLEEFAMFLDKWEKESSQDETNDVMATFESEKPANNGTAPHIAVSRASEAGATDEQKSHQADAAPQKKSALNPRLFGVRTQTVDANTALGRWNDKWSARALATSSVRFLAAPGTTDTSAAVAQTDGYTPLMDNGGAKSTLCCCPS